MNIYLNDSFRKFDNFAQLNINDEKRYRNP